MKCYKCGAEIKCLRCDICGSNFIKNEFLLIFPLSENQLSSIRQFSDSIFLSPKTWEERDAVLSKDRDIQRLSKQVCSKIRDSNGRLYVGQVENHRRNGFGVQFDSNGIIAYAGDWKNDKKHGHGRIYRLNGKCEFEGNFVDGLRDGKGYDIDILGFCRESNWQNGVRISGQQETYLSNNMDRDTYNEECGEIKIETVPGYIDINHLKTMYVGDLIDEERHGFGILYDDRGRKSYEGEWAHDKKHGKGKLFDSTGRCQFDGYFVNGYRDGIGIEYKENDSIVKSLWKNGVRVEN